MLLLCREVEQEHQFKKAWSFYNERHEDILTLGILGEIVQLMTFFISQLA